MINVPLLQGLKEYYDYVNLCNELGRKVGKYENEMWPVHFEYLKEIKSLKEKGEIN